MLTCDCDAVERRKPSRFVPRFRIELRADAPYEFSLATFRGKHPAQKEHIPGLHRLRIDSEWLGRLWEFDAKFFQALLDPIRSRSWTHLSLLPTPAVSTAIYVQDL